MRVAVLSAIPRYKTVRVAANQLVERNKEPFSRSEIGRESNPLFEQPQAP